MTPAARPVLPVLDPPCGCPKHARNRPAPGDQLPAGMGAAIVAARVGGLNPPAVAGGGWPRGGWPKRRTVR